MVPLKVANYRLYRALPHVDDGLFAMKLHKIMFDRPLFSVLNFFNYLEYMKVPGYFIDQSKETFSNIFREVKITRPDFIVHSKNNLFYVDVKYRTKQSYEKNGENRFWIEEENVNSLFKFQNELDASTWIAFTEIKTEISFSSDLNNQIFYYASVSELYDFSL